MHKSTKSVCAVCNENTIHFPRLRHWDNNYYIDKVQYRLFECVACGTAKILSPPIPSEMGRYYPSDYYSYSCNTSPLFRLKELINRRTVLLPTFLRGRILFNTLFVLPPGPHASVLDIGCGDGSALAQYRELGFSEVYGTEIDKNKVTAIRKKYGLKVFYLRDITTVPIEHQNLDVVRISHVLEHVYNPRETLETAHLLLKAGGQLLIGVPNYKSLSSLVMGKYFCGLQLPTHLTHFNKRSIVKLVQDVGFDVIEMRTVGYSGFASSLKTLFRDRFKLKINDYVFYFFILLFLPAEFVQNILGQGFMINLRAIKREA